MHVSWDLKLNVSPWDIPLRRVGNGAGIPRPRRGPAPNGDGDGDGEKIQSPSGDGDGDGGQFSPVPVPASPLCDIMSLALFYVFLNVMMFEQKLAMWEL